MPRERKHVTAVVFFAPDQTGFLGYSYRLRALCERYCVTVIGNVALDRPEFEIEGLEKITLGHRNGQLGWLLFLCKAFFRILFRKTDAIVLLHSTTSPLAIVLKFIGPPVFLYWNEHPTHWAPPTDSLYSLTSAIRFFARYLMFKGARDASVVMPIGEAHRDDLLKSGAKAEKVEMLYMGVGSDFRFPGPKPSWCESDVLQLIYVGSVAPDRGRDIMLNAMVRIANDPHMSGRVKLTIVGLDESQQEYCQRQLDSAGASGSVRLVGKVTGGQIPPLLSSAHAGLCLWADLPWYRFNPPTKLFEYLVAGLPVLASRIRTHTEYIIDGDNGYIFDYDDRSLYELLKAIVSGGASFHNVNSRAWCSGEKYLWDVIKPKFLGVIQKGLKQ